MRIRIPVRGRASVGSGSGSGHILWGGLYNFLTFCSSQKKSRNYLGVGKVKCESRVICGRSVAGPATERGVLSVRWGGGS